MRELWQPGATPRQPNEGSDTYARRDTWSTSPPKTSQEETSRRERLSQLIQLEIIPRLMLIHRVSAPETETRHPPTPTPTAEDISELTRLLIEKDVASARTLVDGIRGRGVAIDAIYLSLFAPVARLVGELWAADLCTFTDVTIAVSRLQQLVRELSSVFEAEKAFEGPGHLAVFAPAPAEQHNFGMMLVEEFFRRSGWDVIRETTENVIPLVRGQSVTMVGFSAGNKERLEPLAALIAEVRATSLNRRVLVMVGGQCFIDCPEFVDRVGADATAKDAQEAVHVIRRCLEKMAAADEVAEDGTRRWMPPTTQRDLSPPKNPLATSTRKQRPT